MRRGLLTLLLVAGLTACRHAPPVVTPSVPTHALTVHLVDARTGGAVHGTVHVTDGVNAGQRGTADGTGRLRLTLEQAGFTIRAEADGYTPAYVGVTLTEDRVVVVKLRPLSHNLRGRIRAHRRGFVAADGQPWVWRFVTGFRLLDLEADGAGAQADAFLAWVREAGFNGVRVLASAHYLFQLSPAEGRASLSAMFARAKRHDLYVEIVALADTKFYGLSRAQLAAQVKAVGAACAAADNCSNVEIANENDDSTQAADLMDVAFLRSLRSQIPASVLVALGSTDGSQDEQDTFKDGDLLLVHLDRTRDTWNRTRRVKELYELSKRTDLPVVNDEPIGADEQNRGHSRSANAAEFFTLGALSRFFIAGGTFHCEDCLQAKVPGPVQRKLAKAWLDGMALGGDDDVAWRFENGGHSTSVVKDAAYTVPGPGTVVRVFRFYGAGGDLAVLVGLSGDPELELRDGWRVGATVAERLGVKVIRLVKE